MALLAEFSLVPDVFDTTCYTSDELCDVHLQNLKEVLLSEGIVRNLRDGDWLQEFGGETRPWHKRGKELLKKLVTQNRLRPSAAVQPSAPTTDVEWCHEALGSHRATPLHGIVAAPPTCDQFQRERMVASITKLSSAPWWASRSPSVRLTRTLADYQQHLGLVLTCANSIMIIDAHLDPSQQRYAEVVPLLCSMASRASKPLVEIHRVCYVGSGRQREIVQQSDWQDRFRRAMSSRMATAGLEVEVFIWDDFHDRYVITDLIGIGLQNGLDTTADANAVTTWNRLGRNERDDIQREFDQASNRHSLRGRFTLP